MIEQIVGKDGIVAGKDCHIDQKHEVTTIQSYRPTIALTPLPIAGRENRSTEELLFSPEAMALSKVREPGRYRCPT